MQNQKNFIRKRYNNYGKKDNIAASHLLGVRRNFFEERNVHFAAHKYDLPYWEWELEISAGGDGRYWHTGGEGANIRYVSIEGLSVGRVASKNIECRLANLLSSIKELNITIQDEIPSGEVDDGHNQQTDRQTEALNIQCNV